MEIKQTDNFWIKISDKDKGFIESQSVESNLLYAILQKLEEIKCGVIDVENILEQNSTSIKLL